MDFDTAAILICLAIAAGGIMLVWYLFVTCKSVFRRNQNRVETGTAITLSLKVGGLFFNTKIF